MKSEFLYQFQMRQVQHQQFSHYGNGNGIVHSGGTGNGVQAGYGTSGTPIPSIFNRESIIQMLATRRPQTSQRSPIQQQQAPVASIPSTTAAPLVMNQPRYPNPPYAAPGYPGGPYPTMSSDISTKPVNGPPQPGQHPPSTVVQSPFTMHQQMPGSTPQTGYQPEQQHQQHQQQQQQQQQKQQHQ